MAKPPNDVLIFDVKCFFHMLKKSAAIYPSFRSKQLREEGLQQSKQICISDLAKYIGLPLSLLNPPEIEKRKLSIRKKLAAIGRLDMQCSPFTIVSYKYLQT